VDWRPEGFTGLEKLRFPGIPKQLLKPVSPVANEVSSPLWYSESFRVAGSAILKAKLVTT
jgi:hypothetical protein